MAKFLSHILSSVSGSVGGLCYTRSSTGGSMLRAKVYPTPRNSNARNAFNSCVSGASSVWINVLTPADRERWKIISDNHLWLSSSGLRSLTAFNWFSIFYSTYSWVKNRFNLTMTVPYLPSFTRPVIPLPKLVMFKHPFTPNAIRCTFTNPLSTQVRVYGRLSPGMGKSHKLPGGAFSICKYSQANALPFGNNNLFFGNLSPQNWYHIRYRALIFNPGTTFMALSFEGFASLYLT